ncbi:hypothetical protein C3747_99g851c [Trypanosoma cruzi]|uniref:Uncharacterized protein n=2 Tax=Trypanosoma cruzi TaxID=5693 RepID=Q4DLN4_TRYCC|nr:hypothetical protein, conserved [Trypanosoma cruzi]EAN93440.1 hypothetical protein, conserved [Trypanosoma cruzi]KAF8282665.1 hypothetical protein TcYC6_0022500 [Trypanosoma cruzi]PWV07632.1 hypothetical protein C3747_99g851c [Trypanosoma cruzi]RNC54609.1 hypothetical protein TcCL_ESM07956 [Trypanosoma cruzi]|eukprot:XP_815291.1 hypothetical protein [Trypanosoma cruzi strain CL Brener]
MVRYAKRPWYTPVGFMSYAPHSYAALLVFVGTTAVFPFRYKISEYFERQRDGPHVELRRKAVLYYNEIERMHRRQALQNLSSMQEDDSSHRLSATLQGEALRMGHVDQEYNYWYAHQRDALRAEKLLAEVRELQERVSQAQ